MSCPRASAVVLTSIAPVALIISLGRKICFNWRDGERKCSSQFSPKAQSVSEETICSFAKRESRPVFFSEGSQTYAAQQKLGREQFWVAKRLQRKEPRQRDSLRYFRAYGLSGVGRSPVYVHSRNSKGERGERSQHMLYQLLSALHRYASLLHLDINLPQFCSSMFTFRNQLSRGWQSDMTLGALECVNPSPSGRLGRPAIQKHGWQDIQGLIEAFDRAIWLVLVWFVLVLLMLGVCTLLMQFCNGLGLLFNHWECLYSLAELICIDQDVCVPGLSGPLFWAHRSLRGLSVASYVPHALIWPLTFIWPSAISMQNLPPQPSGRHNLLPGV